MKNSYGAIFFSNQWTSIQQKTLTSTCHHSVPCESPHLQQQARREGASSNSLPSRWWRLRNLTEKFPMSQCGSLGGVFFRLVCEHFSGPDTTHHQATINEQECVECQNRKSREETVLRTKEPGKKKKPIPVFKSSGFTGGQSPHQLVLKII